MDFWMQEYLSGNRNSRISAIEFCSRVDQGFHQLIDFVAVETDQELLQLISERLIEHKAKERAIGKMSLLLRSQSPIIRRAALELARLNFKELSRVEVVGFFRFLANDDPELISEFTFQAGLLPKNLLINRADECLRLIGKECESFPETKIPLSTFLGIANSQVDSDSRVIEWLHSDHSLIRRATAFGLVFNEKFLPSFVHHLANISDQIVRLLILTGLMRHGSTIPTNVIRLFLNDACPRIRGMAFALVPPNNDLSEDIETWTSGVTDANCYVRMMAYRNIGKVPKNLPSMWSHFEAALQDPDPVIRIEAVDALEGISDFSVIREVLNDLVFDENTSLLEHVVSCFQQHVLAGRVNREDVLLFITQLANQDIPEARRSAAFIASRLGKVYAEVIPVLIRLLFDRDSSVREVSIESISSFSQDFLAPLLDIVAEALSDSSYYVREQTVILLGRFGHKANAFTEKLRPFLKSDSALLRFHACRSLIQIGSDSKDTVSVLDDLKNSDNQDVRGLSKRLLTEITD